MLSPPPSLTLPGKFMGSTTCMAYHLLKLRPCWPSHTLVFDSGTSSAVVPPVGTYVQVSFTALFCDMSVACTGDRQSVAGAQAVGDTLFVLAFRSHLFLMPCLV